MKIMKMVKMVKMVRMMKWSDKIYQVRNLSSDKREKSCLLKTNKDALTAGNKINGYNSRAALAKDMLVILLGKNLEI